MDVLFTPPFTGIRAAMEELFPLPWGKPTTVAGQKFSKLPNCPYLIEHWPWIVLFKKRRGKMLKLFYLLNVTDKDDLSVLIANSLK